MIKNCKFEVDVTYNPDFFAEGEIRETIKKAIRDLNDKKESAFGKSSMIDPGRTNNGMTGTVSTIDSVDENTATQSEAGTIDLIETLVSLSSCMDDEEESTMVLPEPKLEELMHEVRTAFKD